MQSIGAYFLKYFSVRSSFRKSIPSKVMPQLADALFITFFAFLDSFFPSVYPSLDGKNKCSRISLVFIKTVLYPKLLGHLSFFFYLLLGGNGRKYRKRYTHLYLSMATLTNIMSFLPNVYIYS